MRASLVRLNVTLVACSLGLVACNNDGSTSSSTSGTSSPNNATTSSGTSSTSGTTTGPSSSTTGSSSTTNGSAGSGSAGSTSGASSGTGSQNGSGGTTSTSSAQIVINATSTLGSISADQIGTNLGIWYDVADSSLPSQVASTQPHMLRWPGGSLSDQYHWQNHTQCNAKGSSDAAYEQHSTFDNFMGDIITPGGYDAAITVDYGSNVTCSGGGDPNEAAAWVAYAKSKGYNSRIHYWTIGNEVFGGWEFDLHPIPNDPTTYANALSGTHGYYQLMKAADPTAQVGVVVVGGSFPTNWDNVVLAGAPYDFVELHWYAQQPGSESDTYLLNQAPADLTAAVSTLRKELSGAGKPNTPIMLGEFNSVAYNAGKQTTSIVNALFTGMAFGEVLNDQLAVATWWFGAGGTQGCNHNNSSSLYGWQNFGGYDLVAANTQYGWNYCGSGKSVPEGASFPSGNAFTLVSQFATPGNSMLQTSVNSSLSTVRVYAATQGSGYALMLFNLDGANTRTVTVSIQNARAPLYSATTITYGKAQYDQSANYVWAGPVTNQLGSVGTSLSVTLPPWSMTVVKLQ